MKKILLASTAVVAFGLAGAAQAADPIALKLGGYSKWLAGYADNDLEGTDAEVQEFDVKGTAEVWFLGSTTLDNGLKIGVDMQLESGGQAHTRSNNIDEAYVTIDGGFGRIILGAENSAPYLLHVTAPDAAGHLENPEVNFMAGNWIMNPAVLTGGPGAVTVLDFESAPDEAGDAEKITYIMPSFAGFTAGVSYTPGLDNIHAHVQSPMLDDAVLTDLVGVGVAYNNSFGGVGVKLSGGYEVATDNSAAISEHEEFSVGAQFGFAGFTLGGSYNKLSQEDAAGDDFLMDGRVWTAGIQYATGPAAISFAYMDTKHEGSAADPEENEGQVYQVSGKYNMGPGVDAVATIGHADFETEAGDNDGWAAFGGLSLAF